MNNEIAIIGAGVSGITTALTLQSLGYETQIYAEHTYEDLSDWASHPEFASLFPAASVIPHAVNSRKRQNLFSLSQSMFFELHKQSFAGLTYHNHFEIFEFEAEQPAYLELMPNLRTMDQLNADAIPRRPDSPDLDGWAFDGLFADWPYYFPALIKKYKALGGDLIKKRLHKDDLPHISAPMLINCSGTGSIELFADPASEQLLSRGHVLHKPGLPLLKDAQGRIISYNYTPRASVYADFEGNPCDVYCYPRKDGLMLGGSRQTASLHDPDWKSPSQEHDTYRIDDLPVPAQIVDLNREILKTTYDVDFEMTSPIAAKIGYRYTRGNRDGLRLKKEQKTGKTIYHNYGHGGAGVTLSWGCALTIARQIAEQSPKEIQSILLQQM